jgi:hypothetical protein
MAPSAAARALRVLRAARQQSSGNRAFDSIARRPRTGSEERASSRVCACARQDKAELTVWLTAAVVEGPSPSPSLNFQSLLNPTRPLSCMTRGGPQSFT